ncbi:malto-oligosyltrehalose trehalohydrolase [Mucilaginibacter xinganensis]|uniref:Malto-oligosyltrehalose trehalohydrolase n=1 Tax=Mucilaginibacter xinganensis TaxID=1234841 RepID=A0A223NUC4_9SPHI|nr:malto-oligosyltrehalose trehalohydrolase [Mucilaginibacter xinganensis]ASU33360.1 malto-oligosyltrehalose trehalohydrolase [Mucilaginibacter xinganensis]
MATKNSDQRVGVYFIDKDEARVCLWAPFAKKVGLKIDNGKSIALNKQSRGYWTANTHNLKPGDCYKFALDDDRELADPAALAQPQGVHGPSQFVDLAAFKWDDHAWSNPAMHEYIFYELHTGTFTPEGTFDAMERKLDYLLALGITAIEIMPVSQFPGDRNWGYDGVFPFAVQNSYGGAEALQHLVNACHNKGLAVVLDVVYNHVGPEGNYLGEFGPYFTDKYKTPWGSAINFDDARCDAVREFFIQNVLMWFRDFHIDALRLDAVHAIKDFSPKHILQEIRERVDDLSESTGKLHHLVVECDLNDPRFINPLSEEGFGMDAQWVDEFHHALRVSGGQKREGYYTDFNGIADLAKSYADAYVYDGQYAEQRFKKFGARAINNPGRQFVVFSQNHDQVGNRMLGKRTSKLVSFEMQKLMAAAVVVSPYLPMLFMGEEFSQPNPFLYFVSHGEPGLIEAVRKGRREEFKDFHTAGEAPDPQSEQTFESSKINWDLLQREPHTTMLAYYKNLLNLRKKQPALKTPDRSNVKATADIENNTLILQRQSDGQEIICLMNFSNEEKQVVFPGIVHEWNKIMDSADVKWSGPGVSSNGMISPESVIIYCRSHV